MLFALKKKLMGGVIAKRNRQKPFDFRSAEEFSLKGTEDPIVNNSYYFSAHDGVMSFYARLGRRTSMEETWVALFLGGRMYSLKQETFPAGESPLKVEKSGDNWTVSYRGILNDADEVDFRATFMAVQPPVDFTTDMPSERMAAGLANEKWSKALFKGLQTISGQCHYEQEGVLEGILTLNGEKKEFRLPCVRDHSFGNRDWNYMNNHLWLMAVGESFQFNYSMVSYPVMSVLEVGNYRDAEGQHYLKRAGLDLRQAGTGSVPGRLDFEVTLDNMRTIPVSAKVLDGVTYHFQEGQYILHENIAEFTIDGKVCRGILEIGFNGDNSRIFNQRNLTEIRR